MAFKILAITSSPRKDSISTMLAKETIAKIQYAHPDASVVHHDVGSSPFPNVTDDWVSAAFSDAATHSPALKQGIELSNKLVAELIAADAIVIAAPVYNFSVPASLKAWVDQIVRAGLTFSYSGPGQYKGLVPAGKKVYLVISSGGVPVGSPYDAASTYLKNIFGFIGLTDVTVIAADQLQTLGESQITKAKAEIAALAA
jgi:FMN-dependent NADH-azoreductase